MQYGSAFEPFWREYFHSSKRQVLYILGKGFDPRMCEGLETLMAVGPDAIQSCILLDYAVAPGSAPAKYQGLIDENITRLNALVVGTPIQETAIQMWSDNGPARRRTGSQNAARIFRDSTEFEEYTDIVVDVSALPREIYFPLIGQLLQLLDDMERSGTTQQTPNLHVVVAENSNLDRAIKDVGLDESASYLHGFRGAAEMEAANDIPRVWIPVLGEARLERLELVYAHVNPTEICPAFPSPSLDPRRNDDLLVEYHELLFDRWRIEPGNIIYAAERNPFDLYRQLRATVDHYEQALQPLGGCISVVSALSNKLLSVGALLAAYELKSLGRGIAVAHVEAQDYEIDEMGTGTSELFTLWLSGDPYYD